MATQPNKIDDNLRILIENLGFTSQFLNFQIAHMHAAIATLPDKDGLLPKVDEVLGSLEMDFNVDIKSLTDTKTLTFDAIMKRIQVAHSTIRKAQANLVALNNIKPWTGREGITAYMYMRIIALNMHILRFLITTAIQQKKLKQQQISLAKKAFKRARQNKRIIKEAPQQTVNPVVPVIPIEPEDPEAILAQQRQLDAVFLQLEEIFNILKTDVIPKTVEQAQKAQTLVKKEQIAHKDIIKFISSIQFKLEQLQKLKQPAKPSNIKQLTLWAHQQYKGETRTQQEQLMDKCLRLLADPNHIASIEEKKHVLKGLMLFIQRQIAEETFTRSSALKTLADETIKDSKLEEINAIKALQDFQQFIKNNQEVLPKNLKIELQIEFQINKLIQKQAKETIHTTTPPPRSKLS